MPSSTSSSESRARPGFIRLTASDRPGVAQPVPERDIPQQPWGRILAIVAVLLALALAAWEWRMRSLEVLPGDLGDDSSAWAEQRRRLDTETGSNQLAIVGDSRILFDTDLDRFEALTGVRPVQLALQGPNARPFLQNLSDDPDFAGLVIVGIAETSYFRDGIGLKADVLKRYHYESPSQYIGYVLYRLLSRAFGFIEEEYRLSKLVRRLDPNIRTGANGPYNEPWKMISTTDGRQAWLWPRLEHDARLAAHATSVWNGWGRAPPVSDDVIARTLSLTRVAVAKIRARGGDVVFVRPPSAPALRMIEEKRLPRPRGWDALLAAADVRGIHADDDAAMQGLWLPENSHLSRGCATVFTDAYVRRLAAFTQRVTLRADAPPRLAAADCAKY